MKQILISMIPAAGLAFLLHLILHEVGHLLGGLFTGWSLINLQIYHFALIRDKNKIKFRYLPAKNYQCIMYPKSIDADAIAYTTGGYRMNLFVALIGLLMLLIYIEKPLVWSCAWCFFGIGILFYLINGLPNTRRICNDKACYLLLKESSITRACHNAQLIIARCLNEGQIYEEIGENLICLSGKRAENDILAYQAILEYYYYLETNHIDRMCEALGKVAGNTAYGKEYTGINDWGELHYSEERIENLVLDELNYSKELIDIIALEQLYLQLLLRFKGIVSEPINSDMYGLDISQYIKEHGVTGDVHTARVRAIYDAYECIRRGNDKEALVLLNKAHVEIEAVKYLYEGEKIFCIQQLGKIADCIRASILEIVEKVE